MLLTVAMPQRRENGTSNGSDKWFLHGCWSYSSSRSDESRFAYGILWVINVYNDVYNKRESMSEEKAREFWILANSRYWGDEECCVTDTLSDFSEEFRNKTTRVIEYSAYETILKENEELKRQMAGIKTLVRDKWNTDFHEPNAEWLTGWRHACMAICNEIESNK